MSNKTINDYTAANSIDAVNDYLLIEPSNLTVYNKINRNTLLNITGNPVGTTDTQTISNKTLGITNTITVSDSLFTIQDNSDNTKQAQFQLSGNTTGTTRTYALPNASVTLASLTGTETLTNKTITAPTISGGTIDNSTITVDSISGHTTSTIVTVGGVQLNNGVIATTNSITNNGAIAAGAVIPNTLVGSSGTGWAWQPFTPTWTNITVGNGTNKGWYTQIGKLITGYIVFVLGTTSSVGSAAYFTAPVAYSANYPNVSGQFFPVGQATLRAAGTGYSGSVLLNPQVATNAMQLAYATGSPLDFSGISATTPATWTGAGSDAILVAFSYQAA